MIKNIYIIFTIILISACEPVFAAKIHPKAGTTAAPFLKLGIGARAIGMGQSFTAVADDATAPEWNPAGMANVLYKQVVAMHHEHFQDISQDFIGYVHPLREWTYGFTVRGLFYPSDLERRSGIDEDIPEEPFTGYTDTFGGNDISCAFSASKKLSDSLSIGGNIRFIRQKIDSYTGSTFALDAGLLKRFPLEWPYPWNTCSWGAVIQNVGPGIKFIDKTYDLPLNFRTGIASKPAGERLTVAADYTHAIDNYPYISAGVEWNFIKTLFIRTGYRYKLYGNDLGALSGLSTGMGFAFLKDCSFDYAFMPQGDLGNTHRISVKVSLGRQKKEVSRKMELPKILSEDGSEYYIADITVRPKKIALKKITAYIQAQPPENIPVDSINFVAEYPSRSKCPVQIKFAQKTALSDKEKSALPQKALYYRTILTKILPSEMPVNNIVITYSVPKEWMKKNNLSENNIFALDKTGMEFKLKPAGKTAQSLLFEARFSVMPAQIIIIGKN